MQIHDKPQIISALNENVDTFNNYIAPLNKEEFESSPNGKWSAGQNLDHLIRSIKPLQLAYGLPKFALRILFGKTNRPSKTYDELVAKYKAKLAAGGRASGPFIPPFIGFEKKDELIKKYVEQKQKLISKIEKQNEKDLDVFILPHPLLGKVTLREMLYFTIHHNEHHLESLKNRSTRHFGTILQTETIIDELDQYLKSSSLYYVDDDKADELSDDVHDKWSDRFAEAIKHDFFEHSQLNVSLSDDNFELFGDQGASTWWNKIIVEDDSATIKLSFWLKAVINYKKNRIALEENSLRLQDYSGSNEKARNLFRKLKAANKDGYESTINIRTLLLE